jgi:hypothetical protein
MHEKQIPIWFFIGLLVGVYGVLILGTGLYGLVSPPAQPVKLAYLHVDIWWGILLIAIGLFYSLKFRPRAGDGGGA